MNIGYMYRYIAYTREQETGYVMGLFLFVFKRTLNNDYDTFREKVFQYADKNMRGKQLLTNK